MAPLLKSLHIIMPMNNCTKFGALDHSFIILHKIGHKQPDYK